MTSLLLDVIIPVHSAARPISRAVGSVLATRHKGVRALVVCHNISAAEIGRNLNRIEDPRLLLIEHFDGIPSPAGPLNAGTRASEAEFIAFLGSDDEFDTGILDAWLSELRGQDVHIGQLIEDGAGRVLAPAPRIGRFTRLDAATDLLNYRTAPVGAMISRELLMRPESPGFIEGLRTGEDIALGTYIWNTATRIDYSRFANGYRVREDGEDRVTVGPIPLSALTAPVHTLITQAWLENIDTRHRTALACKLIRSQILNPCRERAQKQQLSVDETEAIHRTLDAILAFAPRATGSLTLGETKAVRHLLRGEAEHAQALLSRTGLRSAWGRALPGNLVSALAADGPLRRMLRSLAVPLTLRPYDSTAVSA